MSKTSCQRHYFDHQSASTEQVGVVDINIHYTIHYILYTIHYTAEQLSGIHNIYAGIHAGIHDIYAGIHAGIHVVNRCLAGG